MTRENRVFFFACLAVAVFGSAPSGLAAPFSHGEGFGRVLPIVAEMGVGPVMDAALDGRTLYMIGRGKLHVADLADPAHPKLVATLDGLGNTRQIAVDRGRAYITAREDGLFIVDVARPEQPKLLTHYDTIELATGVAVTGNVLLVACRTYGVELVDVTDPRRPAHLSTVRTGEAQSVAARDGYVYAGVWGTSELVIVDARNPRLPKIVARTPLDGYGDGVALRGRYCYVATGHHSRAIPREEPGDPGYGRGHGLEIFDVASPERPQWLGRVKLPGFYAIGQDMWSVEVSGTRAYVADTYNGAFVIDVTDARHPVVVAQRRLDPPREGQLPSFVGGMAAGHGYLYVAGGASDLHVVAAPDLVAPPQREADRAPTIGPAEAQPGDELCIDRCPGQIHAVALKGDTALVAAGSEGIRLLRLRPSVELLARQATEGFALDVKCVGDRVFLAEGQGGLSVWQIEGSHGLKLLRRYRKPRLSVQQVVVPPGRYGLIHVGPATVEVVDLADPARIRSVLQEKHLGLLYGDQITDGLVDGRYASAFWHVTGYWWIDLAGPGGPRSTGINFASRFSAQDGAAVLGDRLLVINRGKYFLLGREERRPLEEIPQWGVAGHRLSGKPTLDGARLYLCNRFTGDVTALDIGDLAHPKLLAKLELAGNPARAVPDGDRLLIPAGYQGLLAWPRK